MEKIRTTIEAYNEAVDLGVIVEEESGLRDTFFPEPDVTETLDIRVDQYTDSNELARFVDGQSNFTATNDIKSTLYRPREIAETIPMAEANFYALAPGESEYTGELLAKDILTAKQQIKSVLLRHEFMTAQTLTTGKVTDQSGQEVIDWGRDASLSTTANWSTRNPLVSITESYEKIIQKNCSSGNICLLMGQTAYLKFTQNEEVKKILDNRTLSQPSKFELVKVRGKVTRVGDYSFPGIPVPLMILNHSGIYQKRDKSTENIFPKDSVVMASFDSRRTQVYAGNIVPKGDKKAMIVPGKYSMYTYLKQDPVMECLRITSRPFFVPGNIDHVAHIAVA